MTSLKVSRDQVLSFRRRVGGLDERLPKGRRSLRQAAWAGLQDSMPRAALLSIHARVDGAVPTIWRQPPLVQVWGPRFSAYVVAQQDVATFTLARLPEEGPRRRRAEETADRLQGLLGTESITYSDAGKALGVSPNSLRYAALTGRVLIHWDGARRPTVRMVPPSDIEPQKARKEMARRFLRVFGPSTAPSFAGWAGITVAVARATFESLNVIPVRSPLGEAWLLAADEESLRSPAQEPAPARLLPSGDAYYLLQGADRELLVPDAARRDMLWTPRV
ncbi:MAG: winged helix DNA-binding domain-containing protein, partial [Acidimicrobiia bacterium]|nr:winged helix DNA-binding domain-containing protein [Acidimicrobiia bacterium]